MRVLLIGAEGRMGKQMQLYMKNKGIDFVGLDLNSTLPDNEKFDVAVDFSTPAALKQNLKIAVTHKLPIVIATTNHDAKNEHMLKLASKHIPVAVCPNLSLGCLSLNKAIKNFQQIANYDFVLFDTHHKAKQDAPSGTAKQIMSTLAPLGITPQVISVRAGNVVGEHRLIAYGENEVLEIKHTALNRQLFCEGAIAVSKKLLKTNAGLYSIEDLL